ncbi:DNA polymerase [Mycena sanguinolenta]|uniref:DNA polymerase n=1 Tax=Mycena sanguinolenta TaxID=230812 RepID=A0A8H6XUA9_9AGAR|nr:DNA polymerase [Mycena sanguinolenta]
MLARTRPFPILKFSLRAYSVSSGGPNHAILEMLKSNKDEEALRPDKNPYKIRAFTDAIRIIGKLDHPLRSANEAKTLKGVGPGIHRRIQDFFETAGGYSCVPAYVYFVSDNSQAQDVDPEALQQLKEDRVARAELEQISGIGPVKARQLVAAGCRTIEQLRTTPEFLDMLSNVQRVGATYFRHVEARVPRVHLEAVAQGIRDVLSPKYEVIIGGSYRRGALTSSDIHLVVLHPDHVHVPFPTVLPSHIKASPATRTRKKPDGTRPPSVLHDDVVPILQSRGIIAATLSSGDLKWQGIVRLPDPDAAIADDQLAERRRRATAIENGDGVYHRADINLVAQKSRGSALLSLTGDTDFIRDVRVRATKVGTHLNEFGLWRWNDNKQESQEGFWELVRAETEEEVLRELGMEYVEPTKRNFSSLGNTAVSGRKSKGKKSS